MRVFLTGVSGYIGARLADRLTALGYEVVGIDRVSCDRHLFRFVQADLLDTNAYSSELSECDLICHLAAAKGDWGISAEEYDRDNLQATKSLISAAETAGVDQWLFYSTVSVLGPSAVALDERAPRNPDNDYGSSKAACEELFEDYLRKRATATVVSIRPSAVYGPENPWNTNIYRLVEAINTNRFIMIGDGGGIKTTSYIENLLDAHMFLMEKMKKEHLLGHHIYHYVDTPGLTTASLVDILYKCLGKKGPRIRLPLSIVAPIASVSDVLGRVLGIDFPVTSARVRKFCRATNFTAAKLLSAGFVPGHANEDALARTVAWHIAKDIAVEKRTQNCPATPIDSASA